MWKAAAVGAVALGIVGGAMAAPITYTQADYAACPKIAAASKAVMSARQHGVPLVDALGLVEIVDPDYAEEARGMLRLAYDTPAATTDAGRSKVSEAFGKEVYAGCQRDIAKAHSSR